MHQIDKIFQWGENEETIQLSVIRWSVNSIDQELLKNVE